MSNMTCLPNSSQWSEYIVTLKIATRISRTTVHWFTAVIFFIQRAPEPSLPQSRFVPLTRARKANNTTVHVLWEFDLPFAAKFMFQACVSMETATPCTHW